jgi:hypothetical protein
VECAFLTRVWQIVGDVSKQLNCGGGSGRVVYETTIVVRVSAQGPQLAQAPPPRTLIDIVVFSGAVALAGLARIPQPHHEDVTSIGATTQSVDPESFPLD